LFLSKRLGKKGYPPDFRAQLHSLSRVLSIALENTKLYQEVKKVSEMKSDIITIVSHQLRTPITNMRWGSNLLLKGTYGKLTREQFNAVNQVYKSVLETDHMVSRLLNLSRLEKGKLSFTPTECNITTLSQKVIQEMAYIAKNKKISIKLQSTLTKETIYADKERIIDILEILIDNAIKYSTPQTKIIVHLESAVFIQNKNYYDSVAQKTTGIKLSVIDQGMGISKDDQKNIFTKFFRGHNASQQETNGLGVGLAYAKSLIDLHNGIVQIESDLDKGTTINVFLPTK
jgi:signal transduction histidine kinase